MPAEAAALDMRLADLPLSIRPTYASIAIKPDGTMGVSHRTCRAQHAVTYCGCPEVVAALSDLARRRATVVEAVRQLLADPAGTID